MGGKDIQMNLYTPYGLDTEAKGSTEFRMLKTLIYSPKGEAWGFYKRLSILKTVDPIGWNV